ncbi:hypothetical protein KSF78_0007901 [Schistosoma japonicum]|nr:hypothetical protein KSF78_0007901 [Schistosoma japonicum]
MENPNLISHNNNNNVNNEHTTDDTTDNNNNNNNEDNNNNNVQNNYKSMLSHTSMEYESCGENLESFAFILKRQVSLIMAVHSCYDNNVSTLLSDDSHEPKSNHPVVTSLLIYHFVRNLK